VPRPPPFFLHDTVRESKHSRGPYSIQILKVEDPTVLHALPSFSLPPFFPPEFISSGERGVEQKSPFFPFRLYMRIERNAAEMVPLSHRRGEKVKEWDLLPPSTGCSIEADDEERRQERPLFFFPPPLPSFQPHTPGKIASSRTPMLSLFPFPGLRLQRRNQQGEVRGSNYSFSFSLTA